MGSRNSPADILSTNLAKLYSTMEAQCDIVEKCDERLTEVNTLLGKLTQASALYPQYDKIRQENEELRNETDAAYEVNRVRYNAALKAQQEEQDFIFQMSKRIDTGDASQRHCRAAVEVVDAIYKQ